MRLLKLTIVLLGILGVLGGVLVLFWFLSPHLPEYAVRRDEIFNDREATFLIIDLTEAGYRFELHNKPKDQRTVRLWREDLLADIVFNAAYFKDDGTPSGYYNEDGGVSVVVWPDSDAQSELASYSFLVEVHSDDLVLSYLPLKSKIEPEGAAFLSFPTLVLNGRPLVKEDSLLRSERTILAEGKNGHDYLVITEKGNISLFEAANWLSLQPEEFVIAGNLDGGPSTGLSLENGNFDLEDASAAVPSVISGYLW